MAILLWNVIIAATFVVLAGGVVAYVFMNLFLAGLKKGAALVSAYDQQTLGRWILSQCDATGDGRVTAHFPRGVFHKLSSSPWSLNRAPRNRHTL